MFVFEVTGHNGFRGHKRGTRFMAALRSPELRAVQRGDIRQITRCTPSLLPGTYVLPDGWATKGDR